ncbi:hypothetical protein CC1G_03390 [Coprinopsis cinerea okayama7|uniref:Uncharacterized protein n=1 Tax=Coprinopsis cinerea (strain Okayama-7 / 130 / ATCC MYA-4618 / FGSC 9003) TaxID=240176 RepID=A8NQJ2_COPC7|nr:hypothetical protein CC1G_03390 [Coprinopsis cinerea okayama7\|eukprot:XP_001835608.2 hypothetical protein CC1G_03390 [Coprinopsis cinerea okayama7\
MATRSRPRPIPVSISANAPPVPKLSQQSAAKFSRELVSKLSLTPAPSVSDMTASSSSSSLGQNVPPLPLLKRKLVPSSKEPRNAQASIPKVASNNTTTVNSGSKISPKANKDALEEEERRSYLRRIRELEQWKEERLAVEAKEKIVPIERPEGQARRKWDIGEAMELPGGSKDVQYRSMMNKLAILQDKYKIPRGASLARGAYVTEVAGIFTDMREAFPYLCEQRFRDGWPIYDMLQCKLQDQRQYDNQRERRLASQQRRRERARAALAKEDKKREKKEKKAKEKRRASPSPPIDDSDSSGSTPPSSPSAPSNESPMAEPTTPALDADVNSVGAEVAPEDDSEVDPDEADKFLLSILAQLGPVLGLHFLDTIPHPNFDFTYSTWPQYDDESKAFWEEKDDEIHEQLSDATCTSDPQWWLQVISERIVEDSDFEAFWPVFYTKYLELEVDPRDEISEPKRADSPLDLGQLSDVPSNPSPKPKKAPKAKAKGKAVNVKLEKIVLPSRMGSSDSSTSPKRNKDTKGKGKATHMITEKLSQPTRVNPKRNTKP